MGVYSYKTKRGMSYWYQVKVGGHFFCKRVFHLLSDARAAMSQVVYSHRGGFLEECPDFNTLCGVYLEHVKPTMKESTFYALSHQIKNYFIGHMRNKRIDLLKSYDYEYWWNWIKGLPYKKKNNILNIFNSIFDFASVNFYYFSKDYRKLVPYKDYSINDPIKNMSKVRVLTMSELTSFMFAVTDEEYRLLFLLGFVKGMRISEVRGLQAKALVGQHLYVFQQVGHLGKTPRMVSLKSSSSNRVYVLPLSLSDAFHDWIKKYGIKSDGFIFFSRLEGTAKPLGENTIIREMRRACKVSGVKYFSFHKLRHTQATMLHEEGVDDTSISMYLGHHDPKITEKYYLYETKTIEKRISDKFQKIAKYFLEK